MKSITKVKLVLSIPQNSSIQSTRGQFITINSPELIVLQALIGPILLPQLSSADVQLSAGLSSVQDTLSGKNNVYIQMLQQSYVLKYLINSQLIAALMLIDQKVPITYYIVQQVFSSTVFLYTPPFESAEASFVQPSLPFGIKIDPSRFPHQVPAQPILRRFRMSNNFLLNNCQSLLMLGLLLVAYATAFRLYDRTRRTEGDWVARRSTSRKLKVFLLNRIYATFESSFLIISISVLLQLQAINFESALNGFSSLVAFAFLILASWRGYAIFKMVNRRGERASHYAELTSYFDQLLSDLRYAEFMQEREGSTRFERFRGFCRINFHLISYVKKLLLSVILVFLSAQPLAQIILILGLSVASAAITLITRPFVYRALNFLRVLVELISVLLLVMHLVLYAEEQKIEQQDQMDENLVEQFYTSGKICFLLTMIYVAACILIFLLKLHIDLAELCKKDNSKQNGGERTDSAHKEGKSNMQTLIELSSY